MFSLVLKPHFCQTHVVRRVFYFLSFHSFLNTVKCKNIIVAGANAGIKQNGKFAISVTPCEPVSMESFVVIIAVVKTETTSKSPKMFQAIVNGFCICFFVCNCHCYKNAEQCSCNISNTSYVCKLCWNNTISICD